MFGELHCVVRGFKSMKTYYRKLEDVRVTRARLSLPVSAEIAEPVFGRHGPQPTSIHLALHHLVATTLSKY